ncbi:PIH1 domain-containing protein 1-like [Diadema setosum]|uniref:PIH1 domain-containing protein 1-like n=1 Tax=Diadema setosum TaxID=31175 RepID=UPI003B3BBC6E
MAAHTDGSVSKDAFDKSLLELDEESLYKHLLLQATENAGGLFGDGQPEPSPLASNVVTPEPGVCIKTKDNTGGKVFINLCHTSEMPAPKDINDAELLELLESPEITDYRVPMSIGEAHAEIDNSGNGCTAYDIMINKKFFDKVEKNNLFKGFLMSVAFEALEQKYNILLNRNWSQLKKRKCLGTLHQHNLRAKSKPRILEMEHPEESADSTLPADSRGQQVTAKKPLITELTSEVQSSPGTESDAEGVKAPEPKYTMMREPIDGHPEFLVVDIELPGVKTAKTLTLDLGEDRILLHAHPRAYHLDIFLPFDVDQDTSGSQFNRDTQTLTLTLPVKPA